MNEGKKDRRDPIRTIKPKNPVAKNASAAIGGGAAGAHKDKKKAAKQGDVKHKKQEYAESYEARLTRLLKESTDNPKLAAIIKNIQARVPAAAVKRPEIMQRVAQMIAQADPTVQDAMATAQQLVQQYGQGAPAPAQANVHDIKAQVRSGDVMAQLPKTSAGTPGYAQQQGVAEGNPWANVIHTTDRSAEKAQREQEHKKQAGLAAKVLKNHSQALDPKEIDLLTRYNLHHRGKPGVRLDNYDVKQAQQLIQNVLRFNEQGVAEAPESALDQYRKSSAEADKRLADREAARKAAPGKQLGKTISDLEKRYKTKEGWTHDSLADELFEHERTYEEQLASKLARQLKK